MSLQRLATGLQIFMVKSQNPRPKTVGSSGRDALFKSTPPVSPLRIQFGVPCEMTRVTTIEKAASVFHMIGWKLREKTWNPSYGLWYNLVI
jgi:hypothetical protein